MSNFGSLRFYLGVEFLVLKVGLIFTQCAYILSMLKEFWMDDVNPTSIPLPEGLKLGHELDAELFNAFVYCRLVGKLIYLFNSQLNLLFVVGVFNKYMHDPKEQHWWVAKHILRYLKGTIDFGIAYGRDKSTTIMGYTYGNWGNDQDDHKSIIGYVFKFIGGPITWASKRQKAIFLSSIDAKTKAIAEGVKESIWLCTLLGRIEGKQLNNIPLFCDNQSALKWARNLVLPCKFQTC